MNLELKNKMEIIKKDLYDRDQELRREFEMTKAISTKEEKERIKSEVIKVDQAYREVKGDLKIYKELAEEVELGISSKDDLFIFENRLANKYHVDLYKKVEKEPEKQEVVAVKKPKSRLTSFLAGVLAGAILLTGANLYFHNKRNKENVRANVNYEETVPTPVPSDNLVEVTPEPTPAPTPEPTPAPTPEPTPAATPEPTPAPTPTPEVEQAIEEVVAELPFEEYGNYTDVNDEAQLRRRAEWYYNTFIADPNKPSNAGAKLFSVEQIMQDMRMISGEFMIGEDGNITYNDMDMIAVANDLHTIANFDSFKQYGTQIYFTPMAPLFEDGSLAQIAAIQLDQAMERVVAAIRANDDEAFLAAAREWGIIVINQFNYVDFTGEYVSIYQVETPTAFALYHAMSAKYASTILEYSEKRHLNVCIPYCYDYETDELQEVALSEIMYTINEVATDAVAVRSGHQEEYARNNYSLPENLFLEAKEYFNSKYNLEQGSSRTLK